MSPNPSPDQDVGDLGPREVGGGVDDHADGPMMITREAEGERDEDREHDRDGGFEIAVSVAEESCHTEIEQRKGG